MNKIGKCTFRQLPQKYRDLFESGANQRIDLVFVPEKYPWAILLGVPIFLVYSIVPLALITDVGFSPTSLVGILAICLTCFILWLCIQGVYRSIRAIIMSRRGIERFGMIVDDENIVVRFLHLADPRECLFIPRSHLLASAVYREFNEGNGSNRGSVLRVKFRRFGKTTWVDFARRNTFEWNLSKLDDYLQSLAV